MTENQTQAGQSEPEHACPEAAADAEHDDADDERVHRVERRHRRVRVGRVRDQPARVVDAGVLRQRVDESPGREHPRRRRRDEDVTDEADHVRHDQPVAEAREPLVVPEVDPEQRGADDDELGEPVRVGRRLDQELGRVDEALDRRLEQRSRPLLDPDHVQPVPERRRDVPVGQAAGDLVDDVEAEPEGDLEREMPPAARQPPARRLGVAGHRSYSVTAPGTD